MDWTSLHCIDAEVDDSFEKTHHNQHHRPFGISVFLKLRKASTADDSVVPADESLTVFSSSASLPFCHNESVTAP